MKLTKAELIQKIADDMPGTAKSVIERVLDEYADHALLALNDGVAVPLPGLGTLKPKDRAERNGRNPATGEAIRIPASRSVALTLSQAAKERINA